MSEEPAAYQCSKDGSTIPAAPLAKQHAPAAWTDSPRLKETPPRDKTQCPHCTFTSQDFGEMGCHLYDAHVWTIVDRTMLQMGWTDGYQLPIQPTNDP